MNGSSGLIKQEDRGAQCNRYNKSCEFRRFIKFESDKQHELRTDKSKQNFLQ